MSVQVQHRRDTNTNIEAVTPAVAELGYDTTKKEALIGDGATAGGVRIAKKNVREILIPAQITANQNDYNPAGLKHAGTLIVSTDASRNITGLVPASATDATDGREITIYNAGAQNVVLQDQNAASSAANRFDLGGADVTLGPKQSLSLRYRTQGTLNRWEVAASTAGQGVADGAISARKLASSALGMSMINGTLSFANGGSALTVSLKTLAGTDPSATDPVYVLIRNATAATGDYTVMAITAATSLVLSSGSSLGVPGSSIPFRLWFVGFNDAGTFRLGVINCLSGTDIYPLMGFGIASSTAEGGAGAADNAQTFYTGTAVAAKPFAVLGYGSYETGLGAAGAWTANPTRAQLFGHSVPLPGQRVQKVTAKLTTGATGTTQLPTDDTVPQSTEGDQYLTATITPNSAANILSKAVQLVAAASAAQSVVAALFRDSAASAVAATIATTSGAAAVVPLPFAHDELAGSTAATTYKLRAGTGATSGTVTLTVNGNSGSRLLGGAMATSLAVEELMA